MRTNFAPILANLPLSMLEKRAKKEVCNRSQIQMANIIPMVYWQHFGVMERNEEWLYISGNTLSHITRLNKNCGHLEISKIKHNGCLAIARELQIRVQKLNLPKKKLSRIDNFTLYIGEVDIMVVGRKFCFQSKNFH